MTTPTHGGYIKVVDGIIERNRYALHDWRLVSRTWTGKDLTMPSEHYEWQMTWYCTRCREIREEASAA